MDKFKEHRRKITNDYFIRGYKKNVKTEESKIKLPSSSGVLESLKISGKTNQVEGVSIETPKEIECTGKNGIPISLNGINLVNFNYDWQKTNHGISIETKNNLYYVSGQSTYDASVTSGIYYKVSGLKPNTVYSARISMLSGSFVSGYIRFYCYINNPLTFLDSLCDIWSSKTRVVTGQRSFSEEEITRGVSMGIFVAINEKSSYSDVVLQIDFVEGSYTEENFPEHEDYKTPVNFTINDKLNGIDENKDTLFLDFKNKMIKVNKKVNYVSINDLITEETEFITQNGKNVISIKNVPKKMSGTKSYCSHFLEYDTDNLNDAYYEFTQSDNDYILSFHGVKQNSVEEFLSWAMSENLCLAYVLEKEIEITKSMDMDSEMLNYGATTIIGAEDSGGIEVVYYDIKE